MGDVIKQEPARISRQFAQETGSEFSGGDDGPDIPRLWSILRKRMWLILGVGALLAIPAIIMTFLATPLYRSTATIRIDPESTQVLPYKEITEAGVNAPYAYELYMKTQDQVLRSRKLSRRSEERLREQGYGEIIDQLEGGFREGLEIVRVEGSQVVTLGYVGPEPEFAAAALNAFAQEFIELHFETKYETTQKAREFLENQLEGLRLKVEDAERELIEYAREHGILNSEDNKASVIEQKFNYLNQRLAAVEADYLTKAARFESLKKISAADLPKGLKTPLMTGLENNLFQLEQQLAKLLSQFDENWPEVIRTRQEIARVQQQLRDEKQATIDQEVRQAAMEYDVARKEFQKLAAAMQTQERLVNQLNRDSVQFNILKREVDTNKELYQGLLQRLKQAGVTAGLEFGNIHVLDAGTPRYVPYKPQPVRDISVALLLGLAIGVGLAFLLEYLDKTVKGPQDIEAFGLPSLGVIPVIAVSNGARPGRGRRPGAGLVQSLLESKSSSGLPLLATDVKSRATGNGGNLHPSWKIREAYRVLCASILLSRGDQAPRKILVSSAVTGEGKTTTVAYLGLTLAEAGVSTLMIDADLRKSTLTNCFGFSKHPGMSLYLSGNSDPNDLPEVQSTFTENLFFLPAGLRPPSPMALLNSARFGYLLKAFSERFRCILIDGPPILTVADARIVAPRVDGVVVVIEAGKSPREIVRRACSLLDRAGGQILGAAINQFDLSDPEYKYYDRYYFDEDYASKAFSAGNEPVRKV